MLSDNIFFYGIKAEIMLCVFQRRFGMGESVKAVLFWIILPSVMKIIVEESASDQTFFVAGDTEQIRNLAADVSHRNGMCIPCGIAVMDECRKPLDIVISCCATHHS